MKRTQILIILFLMIVLAANAQSITQTVKGTVVDLESQMPLDGATVVVVSSNNKQMGTITDAKGKYKIENVPIGRYSVQVNYLGYQPVKMQEILVSSGKEVVLPVALQQLTTKVADITVHASGRKDHAMNSMASISARSFTVEETRRYAGGLDDPARMASAFAGVTVGNVQNNAIVIRGNSPKGIAWHLEGVEIPNPNHFAGGNVAGGGVVTIFSSQMLANSDFFTGAWPSEYGNALAGVFDMKLRTGNPDKREYAFQAGVLGLDFASEGPIVKGRQATYLFNYRYSTFGLLTNLKILPSDEIPRYQDLSFKFNFPTKAGNFSLWGIGGDDSDIASLEMDSTQWESDDDRTKYDWTLKMGAIGINHKIRAGSHSYVNTTIALTGTKNIMDTKRLNDEMVIKPRSFLSDKSGRLVCNSYMNTKLSNKHTIRTGITMDELFVNIDMNGSSTENSQDWINYANQQGQTTYGEAYFQSKYEIIPTVTSNVGFNINYFALNNKVSFDPRVAINWQVGSNHTLSFGYGKHTQMEELRMYYVTKEEDDKTVYPNKKLGLAHAQHFILGYDWRINSNLRLKVEPYLQLLYNVPGIKDSCYSLINYNQDWDFNYALVNNSIGRNIGIDITLERFFHDSFYYLATFSLFDSKYKGGDDVWHNTRFNKRYSCNLLVGKELFTQKNRILGVNVRFNIMGGERTSPISEEESIAEKNIVYDETHPFSEQLSPINYLDFTLTYKTNHKNYSGMWALQVKNALACKNDYGYYYNYRSNSIEKDELTLVIPVLSYKIEF